MSDDVTPAPLTPEQSAIIAQTLFGPTIKRMIMLTQNLVQSTGTGDFAMWAPLATMEQVMLDLKWSTNRPIELQRFLALCVHSLRTHAQRLETYRLALDAVRPGEVFPLLPEWREADTVRMYEEIAALYPTPPPAIPCALCEGRGEVEETRPASPTEANGGLSEESRFVQCAACLGTGTERVDG